MLLDNIVHRLALEEPLLRFHGAWWGPFLLEGEKVSLLKPFTYMNLSGLAVGEAVRYFKLALENILIIYDDVSLPFGKLRLRQRGSAGGHKGMASIIGALGSLDIPRLRVGVGAPSKGVDIVDWVLGKLTPKERDLWPQVEDSCWEAVRLWLREDIQTAMTHVNHDAPSSPS